MSQDVKKKLQDFCKRKPIIQAMYLFGSYCKGNNKKNSDIDLAIVVDKNVQDDDLAYDETVYLDKNGNKKSSGVSLSGVSLLQDELEKITNRKIHLHHLDETQPKVTSFVANCKNLIYIKDDMDQKKLEEGFFLKKR
jgi:predicted nucleotidyltransferase